MLYHYNKLDLPSAFHKKYMNVQSCIFSPILCKFSDKEPPNCQKKMYGKIGSADRRNRKIARKILINNIKPIFTSFGQNTVLCIFWSNSG